MFDLTFINGTTLRKKGIIRKADVSTANKDMSPKPLSCICTYYVYQMWQPYNDINERETNEHQKKTTTAKQK